MNPTFRHHKKVDIFVGCSRLPLLSKELHSESLSSPDRIENNFL